MTIYEDFIPAAGETAVALGSFDGLHLGHQKVLAGAVEGKSHGLVPTVLTFQHNPREVLQGSFHSVLMTNAQKVKLLEQLGMEQIYLLSFANIMNFTPSQFVKDVLIDVLHAKKVTCGFNFHFGKGAIANSDDLKQLCKAYGIAVEIVPAVKINGKTVSSTKIRTLITQGKVDRAAELLGRPFGFDFTVVHGRQLGRKIGFPTINQPFPDDFILPKFGVYASEVTINGQHYYGVTNVGVKPTVGSDHPLAETWIPDYKGSLYGKRIPVNLIQFIRPEKKFESLEELQAEISRNREMAQNISKTYVIK